MLNNLFKCEINIPNTAPAAPPAPAVPPCTRDIETLMETRDCLVGAPTAAIRIFP